jgi:hypothetical protein
MSISNLYKDQFAPNANLKCKTITCTDMNADEHTCDSMNCQNMNCTSIITNTFQVNNPTYNFMECGSTGGQTLSNNAVTSLTFWGVSNVLGDAIVKANDIDPLDNAYDFIVQEDGIYSVETTVTFSANPNGERVLIIYIQGGNKGHELDSATAPNAKRMHVSARDYMEAGDRIRIAGFQNSGGDLSIGTSAGLNRLTIFKEQ